MNIILLKKMQFKVIGVLCTGIYLIMLILIRKIFIYQTAHYLKNRLKNIVQQHNNCTFILDKNAATELTRFKTPWLTGEIEWTPKMIKRAVINMALKLNKPVLSLTNDDYRENGLAELLAEKGDAYEMNLQ